MPEADPRHLLVAVAKALKRLKIPYLVTGGLAVLVWGRPRFTADIDIVIELAEHDIQRFAKEFRALGRAGYIDEEMIRDAVLRHDEFNFIDGETGVKVDFWVRDTRDPFDASRFKRRVKKQILGEPIYFVAPEDLILIKLKWHKDSGSSRQLEDIESIFKISSDKLDLVYIEKWAKKLGGLDIIRGLIKGVQTE